MNNDSKEFWKKVIDNIDERFVDEAAESIKFKTPVKENNSGEVPITQAKEFKEAEPVKKGFSHYAVPVMAAAAVVLIVSAAFVWGNMNHVPVESSDPANTPSVPLNTGSYDTGEYVTDHPVEIPEENEPVPNTGELDNIADYIIPFGDEGFKIPVPDPLEEGAYEMNTDLLEEYFTGRWYDPTIKYMGENSRLNFEDENGDVYVWIDGLKMEFAGAAECEMSGNGKYDGNTGKICFSAFESPERGGFVIFCAVPYGINGNTEYIMYRYDAGGTDTIISDYSAVYTTIYDPVYDYGIDTDKTALVPTDFSLYKMDFGLFEKYFYYNFNVNQNYGGELLYAEFNYYDAKFGNENFVFGRDECLGFYETDLDEANKICYMAMKTDDTVTLFCSMITDYYNGNGVVVTLYRFDNVKNGESRQRSDFDSLLDFKVYMKDYGDPHIGGALGYFGILKLCADYDIPYKSLNNIRLDNAGYVRDTSFKADWGYAEIVEKNTGNIKIALRFFPAKTDGTVDENKIGEPKDFLLEFKYGESSDTWVRQPEAEEFYIPDNDVTPILITEPDDKTYELYNSFDFEIYERFFGGKWNSVSDYTPRTYVEFSYHNDAWYWGWAHPTGIYETEKGYFIQGVNGGMGEMYYIPKSRTDIMYYYSDIDMLYYDGGQLLAGKYISVFRKESEPEEGGLDLTGKLGVAGREKLSSVIEKEAYDLITVLCNESFTDNSGTLWTLEGNMYYGLGDFILNTSDEDILNPDNKSISFSVRFTRDGSYDFDNDMGADTENKPEFKYFTFVISKNNDGVWEFTSREPSDYKDSSML